MSSFSFEEGSSILSHNSRGEGREGEGGLEDLSSNNSSIIMEEGPTTEEVVKRHMKDTGYLAEIKGQIAKYVWNLSREKIPNLIVPDRANEQLLIDIYEYLQWVGMRSAAAVLKSESPVDLDVLKKKDYHGGTEEKGEGYKPKLVKLFEEGEHRYAEKKKKKREEVEFAFTQEQEQQTSLIEETQQKPEVTDANNQTVVAELKSVGSATNTQVVTESGSQTPKVEVKSTASETNLKTLADGGNQTEGKDVKEKGSETNNHVGTEAGTTTKDIYDFLGSATKNLQQQLNRDESKDLMDLTTSPIKPPSITSTPQAHSETAQGDTTYTVDNVNLNSSTPLDKSPAFFSKSLQNIEERENEQEKSSISELSSKSKGDGDIGEGEGDKDHPKSQPLPKSAEEEKEKGSQPSAKSEDNSTADLLSLSMDEYDTNSNTEDVSLATDTAGVNGCEHYYVYEHNSTSKEM